MEHNFVAHGKRRSGDLSQVPL